MRELKVYIEIKGRQTLVGTIRGNSSEDACFAYDKDYLSGSEAVPISISLPIQTESFSPERTRIFFESLLPEGFSRTAVANWIKADENDYLTILSVLGRECIGAIKIDADGTADEPGYELLSDIKIKELAEEGATRSTQILMETHLSLAGATGKAGLYYDTASHKWFLPKGDAPSTHILKQSHVRLDQIVLNEQLCAIAAKKLGINVSDSFIVNTGDADEEMLYATKRYDRVLSKDEYIDDLARPYRLHQEDFAQALGIFARDKYEKTPSMYMHRMFNLIKDYSTDPIADQQALLRIIVFNFLIGNTDCHVKNHSLLYDADLKAKRLAPAYDLVATGVYKSTSEMSFFIGGESDIKKIDRTCFSKAAEDTGMTSRTVLGIFDDMANRLEDAMEAASGELTNIGFEKAKPLKKIILQTGGYRNI